MARSTLPLLVLMALGTLAAAAYLVLSGSDETSAPPALDPGRPADSVSRSDRVDGGGADLVPWAGHDRGAEAPSGRTQVDTGAHGPTPPRTRAANGVLLVEIVREEDGGPLSGARVTFLDRSAQPGWEAAWNKPVERQAFLRAHGQVLLADAAGILSVPRTSNGALSARFRGHYGELEWSELPREPLRLTLSLPIELRVQLIDAKGHPLRDAMVVLTVKQNGARQKLVQQKATGSEAIATFRRLKENHGAYGAGAQLRIEPGFPCQGDPHLKIDPHALPTEVQELVVGDTGSLRVSVTDERGRPLEESAFVLLGRFATGSEDRAFEELHRVRLMGGRATFANLGLGVTLALRLEGTAERAPQTFEVRGPVHPGQVAEARLDWTQTYPVLVARAVDESGAVLRNRGGSFLWVHDGGGGGSFVRTDTSGELRIVIRDPARSGKPRRLEVQLRSSASAAPMEATRELPSPLEGGVHDLGDLIFRSPPLLVSGVVRDVGGKPLFRANVRVQFAAGATARISGRTTRTDQRGRFTIYGACDVEVFSVVVVHTGFLTLRQKTVRPGTSALELTLVSGGGR